MTDKIQENEITANDWRFMIDAMISPFTSSEEEVEKALSAAPAECTDEAASLRTLYVQHREMIADLRGDLPAAA